MLWKENYNHSYMIPEVSWIKLIICMFILSSNVAHFDLVQKLISNVF